MHRRLTLVIASLLLLLACGERRSSEDELGSESDTTGSSGDDTSSTGEPETDNTTEPEPETETTATETDTGESETGLSECPSVADPVAQATITAPEIDEASGMVRSRSQELLWLHNDSGDSARLFALGLDGQLLATIELAGADAIDWEDLALGPGPSPGDWLYIGDIGDNAEARPGITIYRLPEPADVAGSGPNPIELDNWTALELTYPDSPHDAETLLVDPRRRRSWF
ncbi:MAG: hypothetical protein HC927_14105, partial [Deltaproteobacteria bacterium]|nr:hypothetical protein [Deltaproteobacteria bacterium]